MAEHQKIIKNYVYNTALIVLNALYPLISYPYVARILGPEGIGKVNLATSVVNYFVVLASFGIPVYGMKEIAKAKGDKLKLGTIFSELLVINTICIILTIGFYGSLFFFSEKIQNEHALYLVVGSTLVFNIFSIDWFYTGIEEFRIITLRSFIVKILSLVCIFLLIRHKTDFLLYAGISVLGLSGANLFNALYSRKYVKLSFQNLNLQRHFRPVLSLFFASVIGAAYQNGDSILLGFISNDRSVGLYTTNKKLMFLVISFVKSLATVLIPRLSFYIENLKSAEYNKLAIKSIDFIYFSSLPCILFIMPLSSELLLVFGGQKFVEGSLALSLISPIILITSLVYFTTFQILLPNNEEDKIVIANLIGAFVNIGLNFILIPRFTYYSPSIVILISEMIVVLIQIYFGKQYITFNIIGKRHFPYFIGALGMFMSIIIIKIFITNVIIKLSVVILLAPLIYFSFLILYGDEMTIFLKDRVLFTIQKFVKGI